MIISVSVYNHFYEMPVYKTCRSFRRKVCKVVKDCFPKDEKLLLTAQILDAVRSITSNIAEGFGRFHHQENIQFCRQSRGSLTETMEHLITAYDECYIDKPQLENLNKQYKQCLKEMLKRIKHVHKVSQNSEGQPIINN